jgi:membrane associated rhomboid family serine protease
MITTIIVIITAIISIFAFQRHDIMRKFDFAPWIIAEKGEYYRFLTHAFLHADWMHLIINMLVLFSFGRHVEMIFSELHTSGYLGVPWLTYLILYIGGILLSTLTTYLRHRKDPDYIAVGASGAVSSVLFTSIFFSPMGKILFYGVIPMPGILFGVLYLIYSSYMSKKGGDNINHDAHFWGAVYGFFFPLFIDFSLWKVFINQFQF